MEKDAVIAVLKAAEPALRSQGVAHAALFGSVARGEQRPDSDIDIMVEISAEAEIGVFGFAKIVNLIEDLFPTRVDVSNRACLRPYVRPSAEGEAVYAF
jgi:predicted nucleotidyltransferase